MTLQRQPTIPDIVRECVAMFPTMTTEQAECFAAEFLSHWSDEEAGVAYFRQWATTSRGEGVREYSMGRRAL